MSITKFMFISKQLPIIRIKSCAQSECVQVLKVKKKMLFHTAVCLLPTDTVKAIFSECASLQLINVMLHIRCNLCNNYCLYFPTTRVTPGHNALLPLPFIPTHHMWELCFLLSHDWLVTHPQHFCFFGECRGLCQPEFSHKTKPKMEVWS